MTKAPKVPAGIKPRKEAVNALQAPSTKMQSAQIDKLQFLRQQAGVNYITDVHCRTKQYHYDQLCGRYPNCVVFTRYSTWSEQDQWVKRRETYWKEAEQIVLDRFHEQIVSVRLEEISQLSELKESLFEYVLPRTDKDGNWKRHKSGPFKGLPDIPLMPTSSDKTVKMLLEVIEKLMTKRGEVNTRTETVGGDKAPQSLAAAPEFTREELRAMSRALLLRKQPELNEGKGE